MLIQQLQLSSLPIRLKTDDTTRYSDTSRYDCAGPDNKLCDFYRECACATGQRFETTTPARWSIHRSKRLLLYMFYVHIYTINIHYIGLHRYIPSPNHHSTEAIVAVCKTAQSVVFVHDGSASWRSLGEAPGSKVGTCGKRSSTATEQETHILQIAHVRLTDYRSLLRAILFCNNTHEADSKHG